MVYDQILQDIDAEAEGQLETAKVLLRWLLYTEGPPSLEELWEITMVDPQGASFSIGRKAREASFVSKTLSSFITISDEGFVQFAHQTVPEYLMEDDHYFADRPECHAWMATCCLSYLQYCIVLESLPGPPSIKPKSFGTRFPLTGYAINWWLRHALGAWSDAEESDALTHRDSSSPLAETSPNVEDEPASLSQWATTAKRMLKSATLMPKKTYSTILVDLALQGYEKCIKVLLVSDMRYKTPSYYAWLFSKAINGQYRQVIEHLLLYAPYGSTDTLWWPETGHLADAHLLQHQSHRSIAQSFLDYGVDINHIDDESGWSALHMLAFQGNVATMELLLDYSADPGITDHTGRTALHIAAFQGHVGVVRLWESRRLEFNSIDAMGWTPLHYAVKSAVMELTAVSLPFIHRGLEHPSELLLARHPSLHEELSVQTNWSMPQARRSTRDTLAESIDILMELTKDNVQKPSLSSTVWNPSLKLPDINNQPRDELSEASEEESQECSGTFDGVRATIASWPRLIRIGQTIMEETLPRAQLPRPLLAQPATTRLLGLRSPAFPNEVNSAIVYSGTVSLIRLHVHELILNEGLARLAASHANRIMIRGGTMIVQAQSQVHRLQLYGGSAIFSSPLELDELHIREGCIRFLAPTQLGECAQTRSHIKRLVVNGGSATSLSPLEVDDLVIHGGSVSFLAPKQPGEEILRVQSHVKNLVVHNGAARFSSPIKIDKLTIHGGSFSLLASDQPGGVATEPKSRIEELVVFKGSVIFFTPLELDELFVHGGLVLLLAHCQLEKVVIFGGSIKFAIGSDVGEVVVQGGHVNFLSTPTSDTSHFVHRMTLFDGLTEILVGCKDRRPGNI